MPRLLLLLLGSLVLQLGGCNILGPAGYLLTGPEKQPAAFTLPKDRTAVVFIDDRASRIPQRALRELIGQTAEETLLREGVVKDMVKARLVFSALRNERFGRPMGVAEVGQAVQAQVVIYARIDRFTVSEDQQSFTPVADLSVRVVDAETKQRLFPPPESGRDSHALSIRLAAQQGVNPRSAADRAQAEQLLAQWVGRELAGVFYDHIPMTGPRRLDDAPRPG